MEGIARDVVNRIQKMRKDGGFRVDDRVWVSLHSEGANLIVAAKRFEQMIRGEVLAIEKIRIGIAIPVPTEIEQSFEIEGENVTVRMGRRK